MAGHGFDSRQFPVEHGKHPGNAPELGAGAALGGMLRVRAVGKPPERHEQPGGAARHGAGGVRHGHRAEKELPGQTGHREHGGACHGALPGKQAAQQRAGAQGGRERTRRTGGQIHGQGA